MAPAHQNSLQANPQQDDSRLEGVKAESGALDSQKQPKYSAAMAGNATPAFGRELLEVYELCKPPNEGGARLRRERKRERSCNHANSEHWRASWSLEVPNVGCRLTRDQEKCAFCMALAIGI